MTFGDAQILVCFADFAVLVDQRLHDVVDRRQSVGELVHCPHIEGVNIVPGTGLRFGGHSDVDFLADGGEEVELYFDLIFLGPGIDDFLERCVAGGHPVVP